MVAAALARAGVRADVRSLGLTDVPACGNNAEVLAHHGLDADRCQTVSAAVVDRSANRSYPHADVPKILHWIDDAEVASSSGETFEKRCPIDDRVVAQRRARHGRRRRRARGECRRAAAEAWGRLPPPRRGEILGRAAALLRAKEREFGEIVQTETGKPWKNAVAEVASSADLGAFMESEGSRFYGKTMTSPVPNRAVRTERDADRRVRGDHAVQQPAGRRRVEGVSRARLRQRRRREVARADAVHGDRVREAAAGSRAAARLYSVVQGLGPEVGMPLVEDPRVGLVSFTGSVATGKRIQTDGERAGRSSRKCASSSAARTRSSCATTRT